MRNMFYFQAEGLT